MLYNIDMEFIQAFNPLYAFPIVTVVFCAVIVYVFGFKSPIQPPSFKGLDEDKKYIKKRKTKENQKQSKLISNGKANGVAVSKGKGIEVSGKKDISDNVTEKISNRETSKAKKAVKKVKSQNEEKIVQGKKTENVLSDEHVEDGWVQLVSKKGRKNRKKDENISPNILSKPTESLVQNNLELGDNSKIKESPKYHESDVVTAVEKDISTEKEREKTQHIKEKSVKKKSNTTTPPVFIPDSSINLVTSIESKTTVDENRNESYPNIPTAIEESNKSKKKKKQTVPSDVTVTKITSALPGDVNSKLIEKSSPISQKLEIKSGDVLVNSDIDVKSNVAFDELASLYPEAKEKDKKKKKVRRDH